MTTQDKIKQKLKEAKQDIEKQNESVKRDVNIKLTKTKEEALKANKATLKQVQIIKEASSANDRVIHDRITAVSTVTSNKIADVNTSIYKDLNRTKKAIDNKLELNEVASDFKLQMTKTLLDIAIKSNYKQIEKNKENINSFSKKILEELKIVGNELESVNDRLESIGSIQREHDEEILNIKDDVLTVTGKVEIIEARELGTLVWAYECDDSLGLYEMDGSSYEDADLSDYLGLKNLQGYTIEDNIITTPNLKGRFIGYTGHLGIAGLGVKGNDKTALNGLGLTIGIDKDTGDGGNYKYWGVGGVAHPKYGFTTMDRFFMFGDKETIPNHYGMRLCIKGAL